MTNQLNQEILNKVARQCLSPTIAKDLNLSKQALHGRISTLVKNNYLTKQKKGKLNHFTLTLKGVAELASMANNSMVKDSRGGKQTFTLKSPNPLPTPTKSKRLHSLGLEYPFIETLKPTDPIQIFNENLDLPITQIHLKNNTQAIAHIPITAKITTRGLLLYAPELFISRGQPSIMAEAKAKEILDTYARDLETRINLKLKRLRKGIRDILISYIITEQIADEQHPLGTQATQDQNKIVLARTKDGKERLIADRSKKVFAELEAVSNRTAGEDSDIIDKQFNAILDGDINLIDMDHYIKVLTVSQATFGKNLEAHVQAIKDLSSMAAKINELLDKMNK